MPDTLRQTVADAYNLSSNDIIFSTTQKYLARGGDEVAVSLVHSIGASKPTDPQIERICTLLEFAFQWPQLIDNPTNRSPDVSLLLLSSAKLQTANPALQRRLEKLRSQLAELTKSSQQNN